MDTKTVTSAGGVVYANDADVRVALIGRNDSTIWGLPKGLIEQGETIESAALREILEETGLTGDIVDKISIIDYWFTSKQDNARYHKYVHFFLVRHSGGDTSRHDREVDEVRWYDINDAIAEVTYKGERDIVQKAKVMIEQRHANAAPL